ncbi:glycosyltransferase [Tropicimonas sediminicola]|uniref:Glycosyl transferases group 1 n=1 Tax=Tropicimonas sediminicola TaxID=1031541 RepID=A0A239JHL3_9RHOB|nr:glycosyltransferase [Tropicimonas sediminicola]SNT04783.1 Glycosyl transferases group 1 [Tropicimonas sediminicola]
MKILYYNWVDYLDTENRGGGVSVYLKNLMTHLGAKDGVDVRFVSSGISYDILEPKPRWEKVQHGPRKDRDLRFEIINSGALAPGHHSFGHDAQIEHPATVEAFYDFMEKNGPFDIVHFNNLEGIPASLVGLKERFPETRVILSLHNYFPVCPQVNLWYQERENCIDFRGGEKCGDCLEWQPYPDEVRLANAVAYRFKKAGIEPGGFLFRRGFGLAVRFWSKALRVSKSWSKSSRDVLAFGRTSRDGNVAVRGPLKPVKGYAQTFGPRRARVVEIINQNCDRVLCVSDRVGVVAAKFGIAPELLQTSYIGTKHAELWEKTTPKQSLLNSDGTLTLAYMGYMRRDKGFYFLMRALATLPKSLAERVRVVVCARTGDHEAVQLMHKASSNVKEILHADGYKHDELDKLLAEVDVGVVPVQWEDNLPQVAIEMHARHIPLLTSNLGGAQELGNTPEMVFRANSFESFHQRIRAILEGEIDLDAYWANAMPPVSMEKHEDELLGIYRDLIDGRGRTLPVAEAAAAE